MLDDGRQPGLQLAEDQVTHRFSRLFTGWSGPTVVDDCSWRTVQDVQCRHARRVVVGGGVGVGIKVHPLECDSDPGSGGGRDRRAVEQYQGGVRDLILHRHLGPLFTAHTAQSRSPFRSEVEMGSSA